MGAQAYGHGPTVSTLEWPARRVETPIETVTRSWDLAENKPVRGRRRGAQTPASAYELVCFG